MESQTVVVRDFRPDDLERVKELHAASEIDYKCPDFRHPLFLVTKIYEVGGVIRALGAGMLQAECYLILDKSEWAKPDEKLEAVKQLDIAVMRDLWLKGVDTAVLWLPPGMDRFGERLVEDLGFTKDRGGWLTYSKSTK